MAVPVSPAPIQVPSTSAITLPNGCGAIRGIGEKFAVDPGTGLTSVPIAISPGRPGFGPQLSLPSTSRARNSPFGFGRNVLLPQFVDADELDALVIYGSGRLDC